MPSRIELGHIVCPTDFSECSERALGHAIALARWYDSRVSVLHVLPRVDAPRGALPSPLSQIQLRPTLEAEAKAALGEVIERVARPGLVLELALREGQPARQIGTFLREHRADLLVMGSHGRGAVKRLLLGSVAEALLGKTPCPYLIVGPGAPEATGKPLFRNILCPLELSPSSARTLDFALSLASESDSRLLLLYVGAGTRPPEEFRKALRNLVPDSARDWSLVTERVVVGSVGPEILAAATEAQSDLIVMGAHSGPRVASAVRYVTRRARCPVLAVPDTLPWKRKTTDAGAAVAGPRHAAN